MKNIPDGSVDMVLCDLPYGVTEHEWDNIIDGKRLFEEYKRICKQNANVLLFCQIEFAKYLMSQTFASEFSHCLIWVKENKTRHLSVKKLPLSQYEMILCFRLNKYANKQSVLVKQNCNTPPKNQVIRFCQGVRPLLNE